MLKNYEHLRAEERGRVCPWKRGKTKPYWKPERY